MDKAIVYYNNSVQLSIYLHAYSAAQSQLQSMHKQNKITRTNTRKQKAARSNFHDLDNNNYSVRVSWKVATINHPYLGFRSPLQYLNISYGGSKAV
jgi:hypothetical protein